MTLLIDILLIASTVLIACLGWSAGLTRTFFAVLAGFLSIFAASRYPYQEGINYYLIFVITALFVMMIGGFVLRMVKFFFMNPVDKVGGAVLGVFVWLIVCINVVIPTLTHGTNALEGPKQNTVYKTISKTMHSNIPLFRDYVPPLLEKRVLARQQNDTKQWK